MSTNIVVGCDGHRNGQPCRGKLPTRDPRGDVAWREAVAAGWRGHRLDDGSVIDLCPSGGHDEDSDL